MKRRKVKKKKDITKDIASARAACGKYIEIIIKSCQLTSTDSWRTWQDNYGNKLHIIENSFNITKEKPKFNIEDIYAKSTFELILNNSKWLFMLKSNRHYVFWLLGNDNILRTVDINGGTQSICNTLLSGPKILKFIAQNLHKTFEIVHNIKRIDFIPEFRSSIGYISTYPVHDEILSGILKEIKIG